MFTQNELLRGLVAEEWQQLEQVVERFEQAWPQGQPPELLDFLPARPAWWQAALVEMALLDLDYLLKACASTSSKDYLRCRACWSFSAMFTLPGTGGRTTFAVAVGPLFVRNRGCQSGIAWPCRQPSSRPSHPAALPWCRPPACTGGLGGSSKRSQGQAL